MGKYVIGIDFGTLSGRAVLVEVETGRELASAVSEYSHGVMDEELPNGEKLGPDWALQDPADYLRVLTETIPAVLAEAGVRGEEVIGLGTDFTACTMVATDREGKPLCFYPEWAGHPHAWVKLWKHHAAQPEANRLNEIAAARGEAFLARYGGKISSEWLFPKIWQVLNEAPEVYAAAARFLEAADWIVWQLTGVESRNECTAGYKAIWEKGRGYPDPAFFRALDPRLEHVVAEKLSERFLPLGARAGGLTPAWAKRLGLLPGTAVAVGNVDAHVAVPAATVVTPGKMVMIMGTSTCHLLLGEEARAVPGMCGVARDGIIPGYYGYEAGQAAVGDSFAWLVENGVPAAYSEEARREGVSLHTLLTRKAAALAPGESGLLALDWWNGNRSVLVDADLSGVLFGCTLSTRPEEIYRALIEATAFGTRKIIETFDAHGVPVEELYACGGLPERNPFLMQVYADVTGKTIKVAASSQTSALGSAMHAAVAAGKDVGGYASIVEAAARMARVRETVFRPRPEARAVYDQLYRAYVRLHDYLGRGENPVLKKLKELKLQARAEREAKIAVEEAAGA